MPITVTETTEPGGFAGIRLADHERDLSADLDPKEAAELFAALGKVLGGLARERADEYELKDLAGEEGRGDFLQIGTEDGDTGLLNGLAYLSVNDGECVWLQSDQATATAAALIFHSAGSR